MILLIYSISVIGCISLINYHMRLEYVLYVVLYSFGEIDIGLIIALVCYFRYLEYLLLSNAPNASEN